MKFEKEFKEAISNLPEKEKDKLILRLLKHDFILTNQLQFDLVSTQTKEERREEMEETVRTRVVHMGETHYRIGYLLIEMRNLSGEITKHVKITRDKSGEVSLNLLMLNEVLRSNSRRIGNVSLRRVDSICMYIIVRTFKLLVLIRAMHEDFLFDFKDDLATLGNFINQNENLSRTAISNGLDVNWLTSGDIPEEIKQIQDDLKKRGFLK